MFQKIGYTLEHKWDTLKSMMQSTEPCNSDNHNLLKQQFIIYSVVTAKPLVALKIFIMNAIMQLHKVTPL